MNMNKKVILLALTILFCSCGSKRTTVYLQDFNTPKQVLETRNDYLPKIKRNDELMIQVNSTNEEASAMYNSYTLSTNGTKSLLNYIVHTDGTIVLPIIGSYSVLGKTCDEIRKELTEIIKTDLNDVTVNVRLRSFKFSVLGEVKKPGEFNTPSRRVTILDAIALAGDLTIHGKRNNIKLIRQIDKEIKVYNIDLTSANFIKKSEFFIQQNDVVYVEPNKAKVNASSAGPSANYFISAVGLFITIVTLVVNNSN